MASDQNTVDYLVEQMGLGGELRSRKMFGEYAVYCQNKVIAFVCDNQLFLKPTAIIRQRLKDVVEAPPYPGAKLYFQIDPEYWDNRDYMSDLARVTAAALPFRPTK